MEPLRSKIEMILAGFPLFEIIATLVGAGAALSAAASLIMKKKTLGDNISYLLNDDRWRAFVDNRLPVIVEDGKISEKEWEEIISTLEGIEVDIAARSKDYSLLKISRRSEKAKKLLAVNLIEDSLQQEVPAR